MKSALMTVAMSIVVAAGSGAATPQRYPTKPLRLVVGSAPGSGPDIMARLIGPKLTEAWGQQVVVDIRGGASGAIGAEIVAKATPDGHTLFMLTSNQVIVAALFGELNYDLIRDFSPISLLASTPYILVVNPSVAAASIKELVALAKASPGKLNYGSGGLGSAPHLATVILQNLTRIDVVHVPYKGITPALADTIAGQVQFTIAVIPAVLPMIKTGRLRALGITSLKRTPLVPDLPTIAESFPGYEVTGWYSLVVPASTPNPIISRLNAEAVRALRTPELQERISSLGAEPIGSTPEQLALHLRTQLEKLQKAVKAAGLRRE